MPAPSTNIVKKQMQNNLERRLKKINKDTHQGSISMKNLAYLLSYFIKIGAYMEFNLDSLKQISKSVSILLGSTLHCNNIAGRKLAYNLADLGDRLGKTQLLDFKKINRLNTEVGKDSKKSHIDSDFLLKQNINQFMLDLTRNELKIPDPHCICCSQVFLKDFHINNSNPEYPFLTGLLVAQKIQEHLEKYICAVCNAGGGSIIIGVNKTKTGITAAGINFQSMHEVIKIERQISNVMENIKPNFEYKINKVRVHSSLNSEETVAEEQYRYCFRISITPYRYNRKHYLEIYHPSIAFKVFEFDMQGRLTQIENCSNEEPQDLLYEGLHKSFKNQRGHNLCSHRGIGCSAPCAFPSKLFLEFKSQNAEKLLKKKMSEENSDQPKFRYRYSSILIVGSSKKDSLIKQLVLFLKAKKLACDIEKPFQKEIQQNVKSIWLLTHQERHDLIKGYVRECDKSGSITIIPVISKILQFDKAKITDQQMFKIQQRIRQRYQLKLTLSKVTTNECIGNDPMQIVLGSDAQIVYTYMILESESIRPVFVKNKNDSKKKSKV